MWYKFKNVAIIEIKIWSINLGRLHQKIKKSIDKFNFIKINKITKKRVIELLQMLFLSLIKKITKLE